MMSRYEDAFVALASRGQAIGAAALVERLERDLADTPVVGLRPAPRRRRRLPGFAVAAVALVVVLGLGLVWGFLFAPREEVAGVGAVDWVVVEGLDANIGNVTFGPGGFIRLVQGDRPSLEFSNDGRSWSPIDDPDLDRPSVISWYLVSSSSEWLLTGFDGEASRATMFVSEDGRNWDVANRPVETETERLGAVVPGAGGFLAQTTYRAGLPKWWSEDGRRWEQIDPVGLPDTGWPQLVISGGEGGFVACCRIDAREAFVYSSLDGRQWTESTLPLPAVEGIDSVLMTASWVGDRWIGFGLSGEPQPMMWSSVGGVSWQPLEVPAFLDPPDRAVMGPFSFVAGGRLTMVIATFDEFEDLFGDGLWKMPVGEPESVRAWSSNDGVTWEAGESLEVLPDRVVGGVVDGRTVGLLLTWKEEQQLGEEQPIVTTTMPTVPQEELEPEGVSLQDEILADGVVTRAEYEQALSGWQTCMEARGLEGVTWFVGSEGGAQRGYGSPDPYAGEQEDLLCHQSYLQRVEDAWRP